MVKSQALVEGIITTAPSGPASLLDLSADHFLTYLEALARRLHGDEAVDDLYVDPDAPPPPFVHTEERMRQINELQAMFDR